MSMLTTFIQALFVRLYSVMPEGKWGKQKGATALEYLMIAAALIALLVFLAQSPAVQGAIESAFQNLFESDDLPGGGS